MNIEKLKPCPFCGGVADFRVKLVNPARGLSQIKVGCMDCEAESHHALINMDELKCGTDFLLAAKAASERWNKRSDV